MSKGRKKETKLTITSNDRDFLTTLAKSGRCTAELADKYFSIRYKRILKMLRQGWLQQEAVLIGGKSTYCFRLTDQSRNWVKKNIACVNKLYKPTSMASCHDIKLFETLAQLPRELRESAMTEYDITAAYGNLRNISSPPDVFIPATKITDEMGNQVFMKAHAIEVYTRRYHIADLEKKMTYCKAILNLREEDLIYVKAK